jgi:leucyl aminopeptidase
MTDFASLLLPDRGQPAHRLHLVTADSLAAWRATQGDRVRTGLDALRFKGRPDEVAVLPIDSEWTVVVGVSDAANPGPWALAAAAGKLPAGHYRLAEGAAGLAALGWALAQHHFDRYRASADTEGQRVLLVSGDPTPAVRLAEASALVRDLVNTPTNDLGPAQLAEAVREQARAFGGEVQVTTGEALIDAGFPLVHAVGRASVEAPRLIDLRWGHLSHPKLTLVGKGVTFDSGGLDIKGASGMLLMKKDMGGAAHALALARLVMQAGLPVRLRLIIPAVENAIAGNAFRPGDVLTSRKGLTVEIGNTDAEGRLVLADALTLAQEDSPDLLFNFATLTGAARVALGPDLPALFTHDDGLAAELAAAATAAGDPVWRMPLWAGYRDMLKSSIADLNNAGEGGFAGAITAALFLDRFVGAATCWAHFDLYAWNPAARPGRPKGGAAMTLAACWAVIAARFSSKN